MYRFRAWLDRALPTIVALVGTGVVVLLFLLFFGGMRR